MKKDSLEKAENKSRRRSSGKLTIKERMSFDVQRNLTYWSFGLFGLTSIAVLGIIYFVGFGYMHLEKEILLALISAIIMAIWKKDSIITRFHFSEKKDENDERLNG